ncbi:tetratricopeptide repeat protein [Cognatishimia sp. F0-27]|uniref:tetratricopeptide repeat protein n=1 Tax=Cognatishimia sp. F0-27 TaxID=2816855 RepID=UPI001D0C63B1|nr:tetratricopeptide repeat protein [Cognatishimia sp. F0-27]MCC1493907.1 tetratricopeptide repeat protein [Cognatishimia sp. F0-27]
MKAGIAAALAVFLLCGAQPGAAQQSATLADIRQDLAVLSVELQRLKQELNTTGSSGVQVSGSMLDRINTIESELQRVTAKAENLEFRIGQVVEDGSNRVGDLNFRLCEVEPDCDIANLPDPGRLGGDTVPAPAAAVPPAQDATDALVLNSGELAVSEEADFREAQTALEAGDYSGAAQLFALFRQNYPQGPLEAAALLGEGRALEAGGDTREGARRYLTVYSNYPGATVAPEALWRLGTALAALGSVPEACVTLAELPNRYPQSEFVARAAASKAELGCS